MARHERDILERAVQAVADQAKKASAIVDEAHNAGLDGSHPVTLQAKMLRLELLNVKADLERELGRLVPTAPRADNGFIGSRVLPRLRATGHIESQPARGAGGLGGLIEQTDAARGPTSRPAMMRTMPSSTPPRTSVTMPAIARIAAMIQRIRSVAPSLRRSEQVVPGQLP